LTKSQNFIQVKISKFSEVSKETNYNINCYILDVIFKNTYITVKLCDKTCTKVYSIIWDPHNQIELKGKPIIIFTNSI